MRAVSAIWLGFASLRTFWSSRLNFAERMKEDIQAFKVGINKPRSRGDREEVFGGRGSSWKGAFVGGDLLVDAVTQGERPLYGNFPDGSRYPRT